MHPAGHALTELEDREQRLIERRIREARLPRMKTLEEFDFARNPGISAQQIHELAKGDYIAKAEPIILIGDKRHRQNPSAHPDSWWRPAGRSGGFDSPPPRH